MKRVKIPQTDSIQELAEFFNKHELSEYEDQLEEVTEPVFVRRPDVVHVRLTPKEAEAVRLAARSQGLGEEELVKKWVVERLASS